MDDLTQILSSLKAEDIDSIKAMAEGMGLFGSKGSSEPLQHEIKEEHHGGGDTLSALAPLLGDSGIGGQELQMISKMMGMMKSMNKDDNRTQLLHALKPHLSEPRRKRADDAIKLLRMLDLLPLLKEQGIF